MSDVLPTEQCAAVPLTELLREIPREQRLVWTELDGLKATHYVPVGRYAHEAADEIERFGEVREWVEQWAEAYPLDLFPEPDLKKARAALESVGLTLDAVSASSMRHVITQVRDKMRPAPDVGGSSEK